MVEKDLSFQAYFFLFILVFFGIISFLLIVPYLYYIIGGVLLVYLSYPLYEKINKITGFETLSSILVIVVLIIVAVTPTIYLTQEVISQGNQVLESIGKGTVTILDTDFIENIIYQITGDTINIESIIENAFSQAGNILSSELPVILVTFIDIVIGLFITAVTMYYLFKDGENLFLYLKDIIPLKKDIVERLIKEIDKMSEAILLGHFLTAVIQGVIAGLGLWIVGISNVLFWTSIMIVLAIIPIVGSFLVWGPAGLYIIFIQSDPLPGIGLLIYGSIVVGLSDNFIRAYFVGHRGDIHPLIVIIGVIGGVPLFGVLGVILGPLLLGFFTSLLRVYREDFSKN